MGLHFLGLFRLAFLIREARIHVRDEAARTFGAYVLGLAFAFGWTPCIGPVLAAILALAGRGGHGRRAAPSCSSSIRSGSAFPSCSPRGFAPALPRLVRAVSAGICRRSRKAMGAFWWSPASLFITGQMATISYWMLETFPGLATLG